MSSKSKKRVLGMSGQEHYDLKSRDRLRSLLMLGFMHNF